MRTRTWIGMVLVVAMAMAACGDAGSDGELGSSISVTVTEFEFIPDAYVVEADTPFEVTLTNAGSIDHEWAILNEGVVIESEDEFNEDIVFGEIEAIGAGASATQSFTLPAGTYQVICAIATHFDLGMTSALTVSE